MAERMLLACRADERKTLGSQIPPAAGRSRRCVNRRRARTRMESARGRLRPAAPVTTTLIMFSTMLFSVRAVSTGADDGRSMDQCHLGLRNSFFARIEYQCHEACGSPAGFEGSFIRTTVEGEGAENVLPRSGGGERQ